MIGMAACLLMAGRLPAVPLAALPVAEALRAETRIKPQPLLFVLGAGFGICPRTEALDAYNAVFDDPNIVLIAKLLDLD